MCGPDWKNDGIPFAVVAREAGRRLSSPRDHAGARAARRKYVNMFYFFFFIF